MFQQKKILISSSGLGTIQVFFQYWDLLELYKASMSDTNTQLSPVETLKLDSMKSKWTPSAKVNKQQPAVFFIKWTHSKELKRRCHEMVRIRFSHIRHVCHTSEVQNGFSVCLCRSCRNPVQTFLPQQIHTHTQYWWTDFPLFILKTYLITLHIQLPKHISP